MNEMERLHERISENCKALAAGWTERVEYRVPITYHVKETCVDYSRTGSSGKCACPVKSENRVRQLRRESLLEQLRNFQQNKDVDRNPKSERQPPRVKKPKLHPEMAGFLTLDEITCDAYMVLDRLFEEAGRDRTWLSEPIKTVLTGLPYQVTQFADERPDLARDVLRATDRWVAAARAALRITVSDAMFGDSVCGNCSGGLSVAWDNSGDVRCVGKPSEPPCGETYPMSEWMSLYEQGRR